MKNARRIEIHFWGLHFAGEIDIWWDRARFFCEHCDAAFTSKRKLAEHIQFECELVENWIAKMKRQAAK